MIELFVLSFVAGILTVLAPCILPLLPVIVGGSSLHGNNKQKVTLKQPLIIIASLIVSVIAFTLLLKFTTALLGIPSEVWAIISGGIVLLFGINLLFPKLWEKFMDISRLSLAANRFMGVSQGKTGIRKDILLGAALGPIFNSCSPTYALIVAVILPTSFVTGLGYLIAYSIGLGAVLFLISIFGRILVNKMKWMSNPHGIFQKVIGCLFIIVGLVVIFGIDKQIQTYVLNKGLYDPIIQVEKSFQLN
ncbi:MAG: cytochrome c biogenesis protein CcdA [Candidatus Saccharimonadales bacterium]